MTRDRRKEYARNKARRRLAGLRKSLNDPKWDAESRSNIEGRIKQLENAIAESFTYADGKRIAGHTQKSTYAAARALEILSKETGTRAQLKKVTEFERMSSESANSMFSSFMRSASIDNELSVTIGNRQFTMNNAMVRMFYRVYQPLWNTGGASRAEWNDLILQKTGFRTLEMAFAYALGIGNNEREAEILQKLMENKRLTDEEAKGLYSLLGERTTKYGGDANMVGRAEQATIRESYEQPVAFTATRDEIEAAIRNFLRDDNFTLSELDWQDVNGR